MTPQPDPVESLPLDPDVVRAGVPPAVRPSAAPCLAVLRDRWDVLLVIGAGGALGAAARWAVGGAVASPSGFPLATLVVNVVGSLLLGVLMVLVVEVWSSSRYRRPFLGVGVLGGFTTFSTFEVETHALVTGDHWLLAGGYVVGSLLGGLLAVGLGVAVTRRVAR